MNKTKLLFIITQSELGGAQRWLFDVATNLDKNRYEIIVAAGNNGPLLSNLERQGIKTAVLKNLVRNVNSLKDLLAVLEIYFLIKKEKPEILQLCSTKAGFVGAIAGRLAGVPKIIYRIGGWSFNDPRPAWQNKIFFWLEKLTAPLKHKIIVNSQHDYDQALKLKICPKEKLFLLYNGIELANSKFEILNSKQIQKSKNKKIIIGTIANFYPTKGLGYLIEAIRILNLEFRVSNLEFHIVGDGQERSLLESLIKKYDLKDSVFLVGQKDNPWDYLEKEGVDIFIIPSVKEGLPYALLEAMANSLPIIATTVGGIPEIIKNEESSLLVPSKNPEALAEAISRLTTNYELREKLALNAQRAVKKFDLQKMITAFESILQAKPAH